MDPEILMEEGVGGSKLSETGFFFLSIDPT